MPTRPSRNCSARTRPAGSGSSWRKPRTPRRTSWTFDRRRGPRLLYNNQPAPDEGRAGSFPGQPMARDTVQFVSLFYSAGGERPEAKPAAAEWRPATDVYRTADGWLVKFELAGVAAEDITLSARGNALRVRGRRRDCCAAPGCRQVHMEIAYSRFERQVEL